MKQSLPDVYTFVCFAHSLLNITKNSYRVCICDDMETEQHLFFHCNVHSTAHAVLFIILFVEHIAKCERAERFAFEHLGHVDLLRLF